MEFRVAGSELHLGGPVDGSELALFIDATREHPGIDTVVFRNSPGGDAWTAYRVGERIRDAGLRTVVVGRCVSACTVMFLGGRTRHFAEASRPDLMYLAFHGTWSQAFTQQNTPAFGGRVQLRAWIVARTGGKVDPLLLERFLGLDRRVALLHVYDPRQLRRDDGVSMYFCEGTEAKGSRPYDACEKVNGHDAFSMGFVNSEVRVKVTPPRELPPPFKPKSEAYRWPGDSN